MKVFLPSTYIDLVKHRKAAHLQWAFLRGV